MWTQVQDIRRIKNGVRWTHHCQIRRLCCNPVAFSNQQSDGRQLLSYKLNSLSCVSAELLRCRGRSVPHPSNPNQLPQTNSITATEHVGTCLYVLLKNRCFLYIIVLFFMYLLPSIPHVTLRVTGYGTCRLIYHLAHWQIIFKQWNANRADPSVCLSLCPWEL